MRPALVTASRENVIEWSRTAPCRAFCIARYCDRTCLKEVPGDTVTLAVCFLLSQLGCMPIKQNIEFEDSWAHVLTLWVHIPTHISYLEIEKLSGGYPVRKESKAWCRRKEPPIDLRDGHGRFFCLIHRLCYLGGSGCWQHRLMYVHWCICVSDRKNPSQFNTV